MPIDMVGRQLRAVSAEARALGAEGEGRVTGLGIVYDQWSVLWPGFKERILRGAVEMDRIVKSYVNHDPDQVLSTVDSEPPLILRDTEQGMEYDSPIPPTTYGRDLEINLRRRNVKGSSFAFTVPDGGDRMWQEEDGTVHREIRRLLLFEIGPVTDPAFLESTASLSARAVVDRWRASQPRAGPAISVRRRRLGLWEASSSG